MIFYKVAMFLMITIYAGTMVFIALEAEKIEKIEKEYNKSRKEGK